MRVVSAALLVLAVLSRVAGAEPDEAALGKAQGYPTGTTETMYAERFKVGSFSATNSILPTRFVEPGSKMLPLAKDPAAKITYRYQNAAYSIEDYLQHRRVTALLVLHGDRIVAEHYRYDRKASERFLSFSMAKSVVSLLFGIAVEKGLIKSLDDPADSYVPELKGSGYGQATIRQLLRMSSGVEFDEQYNGRDDIARLRKAQVGITDEKPLAVLASFHGRKSPAGEKFAYASSETTVLGYVLARAARNNMATLTSQWLWQPLGAESQAAWNLGIDGQETTAGSFNATLRDYGRLGLLLANNGRRGAEQIVPEEYLLEATDNARVPAAFRARVATPYYGYGYQFWIFPMRVRTFALLGIYGQCVFVQPASKIVMVQLAVNANPRSPEENIERDALWRGVLQALGGKSE